MRILVVDDHAVVRHGVKQILVVHFATSLFGEAQSAEDYLKLLYRLLMRREPDEAGLAYWQERMARGESRVMVREAFLESDEFRSKHPGYFGAR